MVAIISFPKMHLKDSVNASKVSPMDYSVPDHRGWVLHYDAPGVFVVSF